MRRGIVISLCDRTANMLKPWARAGYECWCVDIAPETATIRRPYSDGNINYVWGDARTWSPPAYSRIAFVSAFPSCTHVAGSGARDFVIKGGALLRDMLELFDACRSHARWSGAPYMIENPVGVLSSIPHIGKPNFYFDPWQYTGYAGGENDNYTKKTCLWTGNGFVMPEPCRNTDIPPDDRVHKATPGDERSNFRSATPSGFAQAVFEANSVASAQTIREQIKGGY